jgi:hypothetical protein
MDVTVTLWGSVLAIKDNPLLTLLSNFNHQDCVQSLSTGRKQNQGAIKTRQAIAQDLDRPQDRAAGFAPHHPAHPISSTR